MVKFKSSKIKLYFRFKVKSDLKDEPKENVNH